MVTKSVAQKRIAALLWVDCIIHHLPSSCWSIVIVILSSLFQLRFRLNDHLAENDIMQSVTISLFWCLRVGTCGIMSLYSFSFHMFRVLNVLL